MSITVLCGVMRRTELHGGTLVLLPDTVAAFRLSLALHLARNDMAEPADEESRAWLCISWWLLQARRSRPCG